MGYYKVKFRAADKNFSRYIRRREACEICGRMDIKLEASHYFGRAKESTRFDPRNVKCLCFTCHKKTHENKRYFTDFMLKELGQDGLDKLELDSNSYQKRDDKLNKIIISELLKSVGMKWE